MRIATVVLFVGDLPRMRRFYVELLGLTVEEESEGWVGLDAGGCRLGLHEAPPAKPDVEPAPAREDTPLKVAFHTADVEVERARLAEAGVRMGPVHAWAGLSLCDGIDPEGNVFQLSSRAPPR